MLGPFPSNAEGLGRRLGLVASCLLRVTRELCPGKTSPASRMRSAAALAKGGDRRGKEQAEEAGPARRRVTAVRIPRRQCQVPGRRDRDSRDDK